MFCGGEWDRWAGTRGGGGGGGGGKDPVQEAQHAKFREAYLGAVACSVDRDGLGKVGGGALQSLPGVGSDQLAQFARLAEGQRAQAMLNALRLHAKL